jgi:hypothetical protein
LTAGRDVTFDSDDVTLAGTLWSPDEQPQCAVVMVGGSGPADRHNDVLFPPIREHLVGTGIAVLSYDKRGVGGSTGSWVGATIGDFAADARSAYDVLRAQVSCPVGLFGHSEGGWVVLRAAAACPEIAFVVTNSCPGMTPGEQDRYSVQVALNTAGEPDDVVSAALALYDRLVTELRRGATFAEVEALLSQSSVAKYFGELDEDAWRSARPKLDHDPVPDLVAVPCPHLAMFGAADELVPVPPSVDTFAAAAARRRPLDTAALTIAVFPAADHRLRTGDADFAPGYLPTLSDWIERMVTRQ